MNTIYITVEDLVAVAEQPVQIVSDNTGYQIQFDFDDAWDDYPLKTAVFVWRKESLTYSKSVPFEGDTVTVPQLGAIGTLYVGVTAGNLQTTTPAEIPCERSILSCGGELPDAPTESEYVQLMELINHTVGESAYDLAVEHGYEGTEEEWLASLKGESGQMGTTPERGVDYWTAEDIAEMEAYIDDAVTGTFGKGTSIPSGSDLNTYMSIGKYYAASNAIAQSLSNSPTKVNFMLYVFSRTIDTTPSQMIIDLNGNLYLRSRSSSAWRDWVTHITTDDLESAIDDALQKAKDNGEFTPVKGEDYFTESEIQDIVERVLAEIPTAEEASF